MLYVIILVGAVVLIRTITVVAMIRDERKRKNQSATW